MRALLQKMLKETQEEQARDDETKSKMVRTKFKENHTKTIGTLILGPARSTGPGRPGLDQTSASQPEANQKTSYEY